MPLLALGSVGGAETPSNWPYFHERGEHVHAILLPAIILYVALLVRRVLEGIGCMPGCIPEGPQEDAALSGEHLYGAQEAAEFLGIHRSTLHLAVTRNVLVPDAHTPGGHLRFRRETLERFAARLKREPATNNSHVLSELVDTLSSHEGDVAFCHRTFARIRQAIPALTMCAVTLHAPTPQDPFALDQLAEEGFPEGVHQLFTEMRPGMEFASTTVLRTREPQVCEDTTKVRRLRLGTLRLVRRMEMGAFAILPILVKDNLLGLLEVASPRPRQIAPAEVSFLQSIADDLGVALSCHDHLKDLRSGLLAIAELTVRAHALHATIAANASLPSDPARDDVSGEGMRNRLGKALGELRDIFVRGSGAAVASVLCGAVPIFALAVPGKAPSACVSAGWCRLSSLLESASASTTPLREQWDGEDGPYEAIALSLPVEGGERCTVGACWHSTRLEPEADEVQLLAFGGACALVLGAVPHQT